METKAKDSEVAENVDEVTDDRPWEDIVFENRNRDYGAYVLRKEYGNNVVFAFTMTILLTILLIVLSI